MKTKSVVTGLCADSLFVDLIPIYQHLFLLEPGRLDDSPFEYTGDFKDTYISRYVYNTVISDAHTYNDITCSIVFNNTYYFGHRGDISAFLKTGDKFNEPVPTRLAHQIVAKFLPLDNSLYALVQDFNSGLVDYIWGPPTSPYASETDNTNYVPFLPGPWSVPVTKLYRKALNQNSWSEDTKFTQQFGLNLIDAISHDNNIYVIAHDRTGSGILSAKYAAGNPDVSGILLSFSGGLLLNESLIGSNMAGTSLFEFVPTTDGRFESVSGIYPTGVIADLNGHHEFYLYNHPAGPYVVHDQVEFLYENISPSSIYPWRSSDKYEVQGYVMKNMGDRYSYRTLGITFLKQELPRPPRLGNPLDIPIQIYPVDVNTPNIKITIAKDHPLSVSQSDETNKYVMKDRSVDSACNRNHIHFITSVTHNKVIYLLVQVDQVMKIYAVRDFGDYIYKIPPIGGNPDANAASGVSTVFGETSYAGIKTYTNFVPSGTFNSGKAGVPFFLDFVPCDLNNTFVTEFNINDIVGFNPGSVYILGDGDDLFIQKPLSKKYKNNKRFATHSTMAVGSNIYVPITCRVDHPTGRLYTFVLGFFSDGSIGLLNKPTGRAQIQFKDGKYVISAMKMTDDSQEYISYRDIQNDPVWGKTILDTIPDQFSKIYNPNASKKWIIGEYDIKIEDNLNVRENF
jgi:hypothetical protein